MSGHARSNVDPRDTAVLDRIDAVLAEIHGYWTNAPTELRSARNAVDVDPLGALDRLLARYEKGTLLLMKAQTALLEVRRRVDNG